MLVAKDGGRNPAYREEDGQRVMKQSEITVRVELGRGTAATTVWTCDLSHDYVSHQRRLPQLTANVCMSDLSKFLERAEALLARLEVLLPALQPPVDWNASIAFRWRKARRARRICSRSSIRTRSGCPICCGIDSRSS